MQSSNHKGAVAEAAIAYEATMLGLPVFKPLSEHSRADLVIEIGGALQRMQCKTARRRGGVLVIDLVSRWLTPAGYVRNPYRPEEVDLIAAHSQEQGCNYLIPFGVVQGMSAIHLRLAPAKNGQRAAVHFATKYEFRGAVAQLEERRHGMAEATGSSPVSSTSQGATRIGAERFRDRLGDYMERAARGEEILITRRGKPHARLGPHPAAAERS